LRVTEDEKVYWVGLSAFPGIGPKRFNLLKQYFGSAKRVWQAPREEILKIGLPQKLTRDFESFRKRVEPKLIFQQLRKSGIKVMTIEDDNYPESLKKIGNPPFIIYLKGRLKPQDELAIAVVGTRKISAYGKQVTESIVADLVAAGLTIISGLAYGVDFLAHQTALNSSGRTIGVWAGGLDSVTPGFRQNIVQKILETGRGAIISEFPLGLNPSRGTFPARNRLISGLSLGVLVTEAARDSGSLITTEHARKQGRKVFAIPGPITSQLSAGTAKLLQSGAKLVYDVKDILGELNLKERGERIKAKTISPESKEEAEILKILENETKHLDQIVRESGLTTAQVASLMSMMEIKGKIKNLGGMVYTINK
jgi:DNA processing protein